MPHVSSSAPALRAQARTAASTASMWRTSDGSLTYSFKSAKASARFIACPPGRSCGGGRLPDRGNDPGEGVEEAVHRGIRLEPGQRQLRVLVGLVGVDAAERQHGEADPLARVGAGRE